MLRSGVDVVRAVLAIAIAALAVVAIGSGPALGQVPEPEFRLSRSSGAAGTTVQFEGHVPPDQAAEYRSPPYFALDRLIDSRCELIVDLPNKHISVSDAGDVSGSFIVGGVGGCFQGDGSLRSALPGEYALIIGPHASFVARFTITPASALPRTGTPSTTGVALAAASLILGTALVVIGTTDSRDRRPRPPV